MTYDFVFVDEESFSRSRYAAQSSINRSRRSNRSVRR